MESRREPPFDAEKVAKRWLELEGEQQAFIGNNWIGQAVMLNYLVKNDFN